MSFLKYSVLVLFLVFSLIGTAQEAEKKVDTGKDVKESEEAGEDAAGKIPPAEKKAEKAGEADEKKVEKKSAADEEGYNIKLRTLEEKINALKDKIYRAKQRLSILQETVLSGAIAGARTTIIHKNDVGGVFKLVTAIYQLDEAPVFRKIDNPDDLTKEEIVVFDGSVVPGPHHVSTYFVYKGEGYGIFSYMKGYTFKLKAGYSFNVEEGRVVTVTATPSDKGSTVQLDDRLDGSFDKQEEVYQKKGGESPAASDSKEN